MEDFDISGVLDQMPEKAEKPNKSAGGDNPSDNDARSTAGPSKELSAQSLARLLGIASTTDIAALETKVDRLLTKLSLVTTKVERISGDIEDLPDNLEKLQSSIKQIKELVRAPNVIDVTTPS